MKILQLIQSINSVACPNLPNDAILEICKYEGAEAVQVHWPSPIIPVAKSSGHENDHIHNHEYHHMKSLMGSGHENDHSHSHDHDLEHHHKKSVVAKVKEKAEAVQVHWPSPIIPVAKSSGNENDHIHSHDHEYHHMKSPKGSGHENNHSHSHNHDLEHHHRKTVHTKVKEKEKAEPVQVHWPSPIIHVAKSSGHENDHIHNHDHEYHHKKSPKGSDHENDHSHSHDHELEHHHKKSVLAKVKEKAKRWRQTLINKKKHSHEHDINTMPPPPISLDEEDECVGQDPEYYGAPMYQSEMASKMYKERASQLQAALPSPKTPKPVLDHGPYATGTEVPPTPVLDHGPAATGIEVPPPVGPVHPPLCAREAIKDITSQHEDAVPSPITPNSTILHSPAIGVPVPLLVPLPQQAHNAPKEPKLHHLDSFKETSTRLDLIAPATVHTQVMETKTEDDEPACVNSGSKNSSKTLTETVTEMFAPAYNFVSEVTSMIAAKIQSPTARDEVGAKMKWDKDAGKMKWDKGVSVKEYLLQKLEPGEEEKALSEIITEAISPRKLGQGEEMSMVEKVKGIVPSLLGKEEQMGTQQVQSCSPSSSRPLFKGTQGASILVSTYKDRDSYIASKDTHEASFTNNAHGGLISPSKHTHKASILSSKDTHGASVPSSGYTHEALIPASQGTCEASIPAPVYTHAASTTSSSGYAHGASITESKRTHGVSVQTSEGSHGASIHAPQCTHAALIPESKHKRRVSISNSIHIHGDSSPLPVSTNPSMIPASTNSPPIPDSTNPSMIPASTNSPPISFSKNLYPSQYNVSTNPSTIQNSAIPHTEVEETSERKLHAYAN